LEPGNLEIAYKGITATPKKRCTQNDSTVFTGFRWENRFRPLMRSYVINPVLYVEFEDLNGADRSFRENFVAGLELYGGLGMAQSFGLNGTSHYLGPIVQFNVPKGPSIGCEPSFGLNASRVGLLWRFRVSYEVEQNFSYFRRS